MRESSYVLLHDKGTLVLEQVLLARDMLCYVVRPASSYGDCPFMLNHT